MAKISEVVMVSIDYNESDGTGVLIVGRKKGKGPIEIINAFSGNEALDIYKLLVTVKENNDGSQRRII